MAQLIRGLDARRVADNLARVRDEIGRDDVEILAAVKYVAPEEMDVLAEAGVTLIGENRAQELEIKTNASTHSWICCRLPRVPGRYRDSCAMNRGAFLRPSAMRHHR